MIEKTIPDRKIRVNFPRERDAPDRTDGLAPALRPQLNSCAMLRRCDRYLLREMTGPFLIALAGLVLFILLNIILSLSDLMVDRGVGMLTLLKLVILKMPSLLVVAVPMAGLFAVFLGLGRLGHDREIVAFESIGIPLRRLLLPLIIAAALVSVVDFAVYNFVVPASEHAYQSAIRNVIFREGAPRITSNAFFKGTKGQFFYVRRYDEEDRTLYGIHIYDTTGTLFPQAGTRLALVTAAEGRWTGTAWELGEGNVYGFDSDGLLVYSGGFDRMTIPLNEGVEEVLSQSRTPSEMGISELRERIARGRENGQRVDEYIVETHLKFSLPLATAVFVLLGGAVSLAFGPRSRAVGIVIGLGLIALFQGILWWTQTLGRRGAMDPALAAWIPDLIFGLVGLFLFLRVDRLAYRDLLSRIRSRLAILSILVLAIGFIARGEGLPLHLECDELFISSDRTEIHAEGNVRASFEESRIEADRLDLVKEEGTWRLAAGGSVRLISGDVLSLAAESVTAYMTESNGVMKTRRMEGDSFHGQSRFTNSAGDEETISFTGKRGAVTFDNEGGAELFEAEGAEITTCDCCSLPLHRQPYTLKAARLLLYPEKLLVASGLTAYVAGIPAFWLPIYVRPLEETLASPLFPAIGKSGLHGWFVKWSLPFFVSRNLYGTVLVDFFSRFVEFGLGGEVRYSGMAGDGRIYAYYFPAKVGEERAELDLKHAIDLGSGWRMTGRFSYAKAGGDLDLSFAFALEGVEDWGDLSLRLSRKTEETSGRIEERIPELNVDLKGYRIHGITIRPGFSAGWFRESVEGSLEASLRLSGTIEATIDPLEVQGFSISPSTGLEVAWYVGPGGERRDRETLSFTTSAKRDGISLDWESSFVRGKSPFTFDQGSTEHRLEWRLEREGALRISLSGAISLAEGPGPIDGTISWGERADWRLDFELDPLAGELSSTRLSGKWEGDGLELSWKIPYFPEEGRFEAATIGVATSESGRSLELTLRLDPNDPSLESAKLAAEIESESGWGASLGVTYSPPATVFRAIEYGIFRDIADCVRVGIEQKEDEVWLYGSITAFPDAVLRYAPGSTSLKFGG